MSKIKNKIRLFITDDPCIVLDPKFFIPLAPIFAWEETSIAKMFNLCAYCFTIYTFHVIRMTLKLSMEIIDIRKITFGWKYVY